jgi:hypothetical protein
VQCLETNFNFGTDLTIFKRTKYILQKKYLLLISLSIFFSCIYKAGNRQPDINFDWEVNVSPYYIKDYMKTIDTFYANRMLITSEIVNYSENFIPVTDSVLGYKYVIEFSSYDSISYRESNYIGLASIYDFKKGHWVRDRDSLKNNELEKFKTFFKDSVLTKVVQRFKDKVPDSLLFVGKQDTIIIKPLK